MARSPRVSIVLLLATLAVFLSSVSFSFWLRFSSHRILFHPQTGNYKLQYRALRDYMANFTNNLFIVRPVLVSQVVYHTRVQQSVSALQFRPIHGFRTSSEGFTVSQFHTPHFACNAHAASFQ